jgi:flagellar biosynthesis/type III secretory pathway protein FliH
MEINEERYRAALEEALSERENKGWLDDAFAQGFRKGYLQGAKEVRYEVAIKLIAHGSLTDEQIADIIGLTVEELLVLKNTPVPE